MFFKKTVKILTIFTSQHCIWFQYLTKNVLIQIRKGINVDFIFDWRFESFLRIFLELALKIKNKFKRN